MNAQRENWFQANPRKARWFVFLLCFIFLEIVCRILVSTGLLYHETYPTTSRPGFWASIDPVVGIWRYPNASLHHVTDCIDQNYQTNSVGARDPERSLQSSDQRRAVVLGDSMVEGHGVARGDRMTDILEVATGVEHLNFGTSGHFGTIQEWLFYKEYASKYDHSDVFVFILPANDFEDNDINEFSRRAYRPYLRDSTDGDGMEVYYPVEFDQRDTSSRAPSTIFKNTLDNNIYVFNALRLGLHAWKESRREGKPAAAINTYDDFSDQDLRHMKYALDKITEEAGDRNVYLFTIPVEGDAEFAIKNGYDFELVNQLTAFANERDNTHYLDLLPTYLDYAERSDIPFRDFSLGCDPHWSRLGGEVAAQAVIDFVYAE